ncbi:MAG: 50S ribosomal protein L25 [Sarcina sp.]
MENLNIEKRTKNTHHEARKTRRAGKVPGVLYGKAIKSTLFEIGSLELNEYISKEGCNSLLNVNLDGCEHKAIIKEIQRDPVSRNIIHIDLAKVDNHTKVTANVPVSFTGEERIIKNGAVVQKQKDSIKVKCEADCIPKVININLEGAKIGDNFKVADVEFGNEISVIDNLESVIATISYEQKRQIEESELVEETQE